MAEEKEVSILVPTTKIGVRKAGIGADYDELQSKLGIFSFVSTALAFFLSSSAIRFYMHPVHLRPSVNGLGFFFISLHFRLWALGTQAAHQQIEFGPSECQVSAMKHRPSTPAGPPGAFTTFRGPR